MTPQSAQEKAREIIRKFSINDDTYLSFTSKPLDVQREIAQALLTQHSQSYKAGLLRASEIAEYVGIIDVAPEGEFELGFDNCAREIAQAIEAEANKGE